MSLIVISVIVQRFENGETPLTASSLAADYNLPVRIVGRLEEKLRMAGLINHVKLDSGEIALSPAKDISGMTVGGFIRKFDSVGEQYFVPGFRKIYAEFLNILKPAINDSYNSLDKIKIKDLPIPSPKIISEELTKILPDSSKPLE